MKHTRQPSRQGTGIMGGTIGAEDYPNWLKGMSADERRSFEKRCVDWDSGPASEPTPYQQKADTNEDRPPVGTKRDIPIWRR